jgi:PAS domain S-box-containing protein
MTSADVSPRLRCSRRGEYAAIRLHSYVQPDGCVSRRSRHGSAGGPKLRHATVVWGAVERTVANRLASDSEEMLAALLESTVDAVYAVDARGVVLFANRAALSILGYAHESDLLGRDSHATIHSPRPDGRPFPESECPLLQPRSTGTPVQVEEDWFIRRDGTHVPVAYSSAPVVVNGARGAVVVFRDITERHRAQAERRRADAIGASRSRLVEAQLEERRRLGRDLHDGAQQRLINVILGLNLVARHIADDESRRLIADAVSQIQEAIEDLRNLSSGLHPTVLTNRGLRAALTSLTAWTPVPVALDVPDDRFPAMIEAAAYFVVAEALANVIKHAEASEVSVTIVPDGDQLRIRVEDDGRGGAAPDRTRRSGLTGLDDRVSAIGGTLQVESPIGAGTRVIASLPRQPSVSQLGEA